MSNMHAAIGIKQLKKHQIIEDSRRHVCRVYNQELGEIKCINVPKTDFHDIVPFLYYIRVPAKDRDNLRTYLFENGVDNGIHWQPGHWFTYFKDVKSGNLDVTDQVAKEILSLPLHSNMAEKDYKHVISTIQSFYSDYK